MMTTMSPSSSDRVADTDSDKGSAATTSATAAQLAEQAKCDANAFFQQGHYKEAEALYSKAIELDPSVPAFWSNRAFVNIKLELFGLAIQDANEALKLDPRFIKAYYRRASAYMALSRFKESLNDFNAVLKYAPRDQDARSKRDEVSKIYQRLQFEKALSYEVAVVSIASQIDITEIEVDASYDGAVWHDDAPISLEFIQDMMNRFDQQKTIHTKYAYKILLQVKQFFDSQATLVDVPIPAGQDGLMTLCGDVHGQYYDLLNIFRKNGLPSATHGYLFNGDFVDRGSFSAEVIMTLLAFKLLYPTTFFMSRGNHETMEMNRVYGFEGEVKHKYSEKMFKLFTEIFNAVPLCNVVANRIFVVHGGLFSRDDVTLADIRAVDRFRQPETGGLMSEMLWADPQLEMGRSPSKRGVGQQFGPDVTARFLALNNLDMVVRSHEVKDEGYAIEHNGKCVTVFSAPNYCDSLGNKGAYINVTRRDPNDTTSRPELDYKYVSFTAVPHPNVRPMQYAASFGRMF